MFNASLTILWLLGMAGLTRDGGPYHRETSPLICSANQWNGFYKIGSSVLKEFKKDIEIESYVFLTIESFLLTFQSSVLNGFLTRLFQCRI